MKLKLLSLLKEPTITKIMTKISEDKFGFETELLTEGIRCLRHRHEDVYSDDELVAGEIQLLHELIEQHGWQKAITAILPSLGKALDKALSGTAPLDAVALGFKPLVIGDCSTQLPSFLGKLFSVVLTNEGNVRMDCGTPKGPPGSTGNVEVSRIVRSLRQILYLFYKYELSYTPEQEQAVIQKFVEVDERLTALHEPLAAISSRLLGSYSHPVRVIRTCAEYTTDKVVRRARLLLERVFGGIDLRDITPTHGPGAVATGEKLWEKWCWTNISKRLSDAYPITEYFYSTMGHVCDHLSKIQDLTEIDTPAKVVLVPKDSRGPRLISEEPLDFQWIQQGQARLIMQHVERLPLTKWNVFFSNQTANQAGALLGSRTGGYVTLDLNEASDRVSLELVRLLFPPQVVELLEAARSGQTLLPDDRVIKLHKFAPMGSATCFPILALTVWSLLTAAAPNRDVRQGILVYGDDVVLPTDFARLGVRVLEDFGLRVNVDKSCFSGLFRESCGVDAYYGSIVTPVRIRTVWNTSRSANVLESWSAYANHFYRNGFFGCYDLIAQHLGRLYGPIPPAEWQVAAPSLIEGYRHEEIRRKRSKRYQKTRYEVLRRKPQALHKVIDGWYMLLRFFTKVKPYKPKPYDGPVVRHTHPEWASMADGETPMSVRSYTPRRPGKLERKWLLSH